MDQAQLNVHRARRELQLATMASDGMPWSTRMHANRQPCTWHGTAKVIASVARTLAPTIMSSSTGALQRFLAPTCSATLVWHFELFHAQRGRCQHPRVLVCSGEHALARLQPQLQLLQP